MDILEFIAFANAMDIAPLALMERLILALPDSFEI
jgi:hypothetical protein